MLSRRGFAKKGAGRIVDSVVILNLGFHAVRVNAVLQAVQLPARVTSLDSGLAEMDGDTFCFD